jgi:hypothetical protein
MENRGSQVSKKGEIKELIACCPPGTPNQVRDGNCHHGQHRHADAQKDPGSHATGPLFIDVRRKSFRHTLSPLAATLPCLTAALTYKSIL